MDVTAYLNAQRTLVDEHLEACLPEANLRPAALHEAMHYCVLNGGKRIRPILCLVTAEAFGVSARQAIAPALAVELYHCSTLVHDDLPCMDDDDLRRGQPTCHVKYGAATAVLTGDALMIHAFHVLAEAGVPALSMELARSAGSTGVIAGQIEDLAAENKPANAELVEYIHRHKTAVLIRAAVRMGGIIGHATDAELECLSLFGEYTGLAFQIADDILDETSTDDVLGKPAGSDVEQNKQTYPAVHGIEAARLKVEELTCLAVDALTPLSRDTQALSAIATHLMNREY